MDFKETKLRLGSYISYCNFMLGSNLIMQRNKKLNQFEVVKKKRKNDIGEKIMIIETGEIRVKIVVKCSNAHIYYSALQENYPDISIKFNEMMFHIYSDKELFNLLNCLERIGFFGNVRSM